MSCAFIFLLLFSVQVVRFSIHIMRSDFNKYHLENYLYLVLTRVNVPRKWTSVYDCVLGTDICINWNCVCVKSVFGFATALLLLCYEWERKDTKTTSFTFNIFFFYYGQMKPKRYSDTKLPGCKERRGQYQKVKNERTNEKSHLHQTKKSKTKQTKKNEQTK